MHFHSTMPADDDYEKRLRRKELSSAAGGLGGGSRSYQPPPSSSIAGSTSSFQDEIRHKSFDDRSVSSTTSAAASSTGGSTFEERLKQKLSSEAINRDRAILKSSSTTAGGGPTDARAAIVDVGKAATPTSAIDQKAYFGVAEVSFDDVFALLRSFRQEGNAIDDGATEEDACGLIMPVSHPSFAKLLDAMASGGMEGLLKKRWDYQFAGLKAYKREHGDCFIPIDHPTLGLWTRIQRDQYCEKQGGGGVAIVEGSVTGLTEKRFTRLKEIGFDDFVRWSLEQDDGGQVTNCSTRSTPTTTSDSSEQQRNTKESLRAELSRKINTYNSSSRVRVSSRPFSIPTDEQNTTTANTNTNTAQKKLGVVTTMKDKELSKRMGNIDEDHEVKSLSLLDLPPRRATEIGNDDVAAESRRISWSELDTAVFDVGLIEY